MPHFTPPSLLEDPPTLPEPDPDNGVGGVRLFRFFKARPAGINVYVYKTGSVSEATFGRVTETDPQATYSTAGVVLSTGWEDIQVALWGGHDNVEISQDVADALTLAGYTVDP